MKILSHKFCRLLVSLLGTIDILAKGGSNNPPSPTGRKSGFDTPPPGLAIDENVVVLIIVAILLGIYVIYKFKLKTKPSV